MVSTKPGRNVHFFSFLTCGSRRSPFFSTCDKTTTVAGGLIVEIKKKIGNSPWFGRDHVAHGSLWLKPLRRHAPDSLFKWSSLRSSRDLIMAFVT